MTLFVQNQTKCLLNVVSYISDYLTTRNWSSFILFSSTFQFLKQTLEKTVMFNMLYNSIIDI